MSGLKFEGILRVAAYCRVSTDKEDQRNSLDAQRRFFRALAAERPDWDLSGVFADEGLSGTSTRRRPQFLEMIRRAMEGEIDLIVTKEVSRFARNTVDTLQVTRQLKERGVGVLFLSDGIDTRDNDGEFRLTIMASVAQEESRKVSERTRWGQLQAMKRGVVFGNNSLYGYTLEGGGLTVQPEQAEVVRWIYHKFLVERKGAYVIARELTAAGVRPPLRPDGPWSPAMVLRILRNEKYAGDLLQKKFRTVDYLTHRKIRNQGEEEQIFLRDHHEAVVSREEFAAAQAELARRAAKGADKSRFSARYWYSGKIRCGFCGRSFVLKRTGRANGGEYRRFVCRGRLSGVCRMRAVRAEAVFACAAGVLGELALDGQAMLSQLLEDLGPARREEGRAAERLRQAIRRQMDRRDRALEAFLDGDLDRQDLRRLSARCEEEAGRLEKQLEELTRRENALDRSPDIRALLERELAGGSAVLDEVIERMTVYPDCLLVEAAELPVRFLVRDGESGGQAAGEQTTAKDGSA